RDLYGCHRHREVFAGENLAAVSSECRPAEQRFVSPLASLFVIAPARAERYDEGPCEVELRSRQCAGRLDVFQACEQVAAVHPGDSLERLAVKRILGRYLGVELGEVGSPAAKCRNYFVAIYHILNDPPVWSTGFSPALR